MTWEVRQGDCVEAMAAMDEASVDAICTDPPYSLRFMGRSWDDQGAGAAIEESHRRWAQEAVRVLKPGGYLLAFGGTRTYHRLTCAIEDAGFEIRDTICWLYGSGFPKSLDVGKAIDKAAGAEREITGLRTYGDGQTYQGGEAAARTGGGIMGEPAEREAEQWDGWGTALKPAHEPIVVARKPLQGTVAANVLEHGTGVLNIDGCRIDTEGEVIHAPQSDPAARAGEVGRAHTYSRLDREEFNARQAASVERANAMGRWPANVALDEEAGRQLDEQSGELKSGRLQTHHKRGGDSQIGTFNIRDRTGEQCDFGGDFGGASRFFYCAKASRSERDAGLSVRNGKICSCPTPEDQAPSLPRDTFEPTAEDVSGSSITGSGSSIEDPSPTASKSTTSTESRPTTESKTSRSSAPSTISESTPPTTAERTKANGSDGAESAANGNLPTPSTTTSVGKAGPSTDDADPATSPASSATNSSAGTTCPSCGGVIGGALRNAHPT